jgi:peptidoglycan/LPS O-acetylase OafA/YrhL
MAFTPLNILCNPGFAIHLFFILSGYVQSFQYLRNPELSLLQKSFVKRYFRLAIPIVSVLLLVFAFHKLGFITKHLVPFDAVTSSWTKSMLPNSLKFIGVVKHGLIEVFLSNNKYYQVLWTMPIELVNSWMVLILLFVTHQIQNKVRLLVFWILIQLFITQSYYSVAFSFGTLICYMELNSPRFRSFFNLHLVKFLCFVTGIYFASYPFIGYEGSTIRSIYKPISFFEKVPHIISYLGGDLLLFCLLLRSETLKVLFSKRVFQFFGNISFMFYLVHLLVILSFSPLLFSSLQGIVNKPLNILITLISSGVVVTILSYLLYQYIDKPALRWCSVYSKKIFGI